MGERTEDLALRGVLPLTIGGDPVELRTLTLDESDEWLDLLSEKLVAVELPSDSGEAAVRGALSAPAASARELVAAYDVDDTIPDIGKATKREIKAALDAMVESEDPFGEGVARSVGAAFGAPSQLLAEMVAAVLATSPAQAASTTGPLPDTASVTGTSGPDGPASSSSSDGPTPMTPKRSA